MVCFDEVHIYLLPVLRSMEHSIQFYSVKSEWSIVYIEGSKVYISQIMSYFFF